MKTKSIFKIIFFLGSILLSKNTFGQLGINATGTPPATNAMLDVSSTTKGFLMPRMSTAQRTTLASAATDGLTVYDTDTKSFWYFNSNTTNWTELLAGNQWLSSGTNLSNLNTGNVGIGLTNPTGRLQINGPGFNSSTNSNGNPHIKLKNTNDDNWAWIRFENADGSRSFAHRYDFFSSAVASRNYAIFYNTTQLFLIDGEGKVKIGTGNPAYPLDVLGDVNLTGKIRVSGNDGVAGNVLKKDNANNMVWMPPSIGFVAKGVAPAISNFQDVPTGISALVVVTLLTNEESDLNNLYSAGAFTVPEDGIYHVDIKLQISDADPGLHTLSIGQYNSAGTSQLGVIRYSEFETNDTNSDKSIGISGDMQLNSTNSYKILYFHNTAASQRIVGSFYSWISLHRVY